MENFLELPKDLGLTASVHMQKFTTSKKRNPTIAQTTNFDLNLTTRKFNGI